MLNVLKIAVRNLIRNWRRTLLTAGLVTIGVVAVLLFVALAGSFKNLMISQITDSYLGHLQIHRRGYVASIENLPLNLNLTATEAEKAAKALDQIPGVTAYSPRVKFGAMFSNFTETTNIRVNGVDSAREIATSPELPNRIVQGSKDGFLKPGEIQLPELLAQGMKVKVGDTVVLVATNRDGSVNGHTFVVRGILSGVTGPGGRDGYIDIADARKLLRMPDSEVSEIAVHLDRLDGVDAAVRRLETALAGDKLPNGRPLFEVHGWERLSPFANIAGMVDMMILFVKIMLVSIVLVSIMNVMIMAVYERIREIGTISAIGTPPRRVLSLFMTEGVLLGLVGAGIGVALSLTAIAILNVHKIPFTFGQGQKLVLSPSIDTMEIVLVTAMVVGMAVIASLQPAWKAARMDPIAALRHV